MKKLFVLFVISLVCAANVFAESAEAKAFRDKVERFLREEGFTPTYDPDDNSLNFKREGNNYWVICEDEGPYYIELHRAGFSYEDNERTLILEAANNANRTKRCGKANVLSSSVSFTCECYVTSIEEFRKTFYKNMKVVDVMRTATVDYYNEHK